MVSLAGPTLQNKFRTEHLALAGKRLKISEKVILASLVNVIKKKEELKQIIESKVILGTFAFAPLRGD